ncbi:hypothetical protein TWF481_008168 [Arthrobotrys musiformis]|uniref:Clr5 domain-containing protein n=1 Tax=Arthrobotrys musiformis TaxID=47236 RepID=A0AAV9W6B6_9PEZI
MPQSTRSNGNRHQKEMEAQKGPLDHLRHEEGCTVEEILEYLKGEGIDVSRSTLEGYFKKWGWTEGQYQIRAREARNRRRKRDRTSGTNGTNVDRFEVATVTTAIETELSDGISTTTRATTVAIGRPEVVKRISTSATAAEPSVSTTNPYFLWLANAGIPNSTPEVPGTDSTGDGGNPQLVSLPEPPRFYSLPDPNFVVVLGIASYMGEAGRPACANILTHVLGVIFTEIEECCGAVEAVSYPDHQGAVEGESAGKMELAAVISGVTERAKRLSCSPPDLPGAKLLRLHCLAFTILNLVLPTLEFLFQDRRFKTTYNPALCVLIGNVRSSVSELLVALPLRPPTPGNAGADLKIDPEWSRYIFLIFWVHAKWIRSPYPDQRPGFEANQGLYNYIYNIGSYWDDSSPYGSLEQRRTRAPGLEGIGQTIIEFPGYPDHKLIGLALSVYEESSIEDLAKSILGAERFAQNSSNSWNRNAICGLDYATYTDLHLETSGEDFNLEITSDCTQTWRGVAELMQLTGSLASRFIDQNAAFPLFVMFPHQLLSLDDSRYLAIMNKKQVGDFFVNNISAFCSENEYLLEQQINLSGPHLARFERLYGTMGNRYPDTSVALCNTIHRLAYPNQPPTEDGSDNRSDFLKKLAQLKSLLIQGIFWA